MSPVWALPEIYISTVAGGTFTQKAATVDDEAPTYGLGKFWYEPDGHRLHIGVDNFWVQIGRDGKDGVDGTQGNPGNDGADAVASSGTGTVIPLDKTAGYYGDMSVANTATAYTTTGTTLGAVAVILINAATQPTVDVGTGVLIPGAPFEASTDMHLVIQYFGVVVQYYFATLS